MSASRQRPGPASSDEPSCNECPVIEECAERRECQRRFLSGETGRVLARGGLHAVCRQAVADEVPRSMSRTAIATLRA